MPVKCICQVCEKIFRVPPSAIKAGGGKHCSRKCAGVTKSKNLIGNQRAKGHKPNKTSYRIGNKPWNKGLKGIHLSPSSEFSEGQEPVNKLQIGALTIRIDKSDKRRRWIKMRDEIGGWIKFARVVWSLEHGRLPAGMVIHHIDQDTLNDNIENLQALTRAEHLDIHRSRT